MSYVTDNLELTMFNASDYVDFEDINSNFQKLDEALNDSVIAQGTYGMWYWRKWRSGFCELFGEAKHETADTSEWQTVKTGLYYKHYSSAPFPFEIYDNKVVGVSPAYEGITGVFFANVRYVKDLMIYYDLITFDKTWTFTGAIRYHVVGRWK